MTILTGPRDVPDLINRATGKLARAASPAIQTRSVVIGIVGKLESPKRRLVREHSLMKRFPADSHASVSLNPSAVHGSPAAIVKTGAGGKHNVTGRIDDRATGRVSL